MVIGKTKYTLPNVDEVGFGVALHMWGGSLIKYMRPAAVHHRHD